MKVAGVQRSSTVAWGASLVVHSTTKFLSGHGSALGGCVVDAGTFDWSAQPERFASLAEPEPAYHGLAFHESFGDLAFTTFAHAVALRDLGPTMAPMNAWLTTQGIETLAVRMERHLAVAVQQRVEAERAAWSLLQHRPPAHLVAPRLISLPLTREAHPEQL